MRLARLLAWLISGAVLAGAAGGAAAADRLIDIADAGQPPVRLFVSDKGSGPALVLLHGLGSSTYAWRALLPALAQRHRVIAIDLKGHGRSDKPDDGRYAAEDHAAAVARVLARLGITRVTLVGHSFGGVVAAKLALGWGARPSGLVRKLVLLDAPLLPQLMPVSADIVRSPLLPELLMTVLPPELLVRAAVSHDDDNLATASAEEIEAYARPFYDRGATAAYLATARSFIAANRTSLAPELAGMRTPTLLIWCRRDTIVPLSTGIELERTLPNARLVVLDRCEHDPHEEQAQETLRLLRPRD